MNKIKVTEGWPLLRAGRAGSVGGPSPWLVGGCLQDHVLLVCRPCPNLYPLHWIRATLKTSLELSYFCKDRIST